MAALYMAWAQLYRRRALSFKNRRSEWFKKWGAKMQDKGVFKWITALAGVGGICVGLVTGLLEARVSIGDQLSAIAATQKSVLSRLDKDEDTIRTLASMAHPPDVSVSEKEHADLLRQVEVNRQNVDTQVKILHDEIIHAEQLTAAGHADLSRRIEHLTLLVVDKDHARIVPESMEVAPPLSDKMNVSGTP
jgi:hypothetical protein